MATSLNLAASEPSESGSHVSMSDAEEIRMNSEGMFEPVDLIFNGPVSYTREISIYQILVFVNLSGRSIRA